MRRRRTTLADRSSSVIHHALRWFTGASWAFITILLRRRMEEQANSSRAATIWTDLFQQITPDERAADRAPAKSLTLFSLGLATLVLHWCFTGIGWQGG